MTQKPHLPTLGTTLIIVVVLFVVYHFAFKRQGDKLHKGITYLFYAIIGVLIITHAAGFAGAVTAVGGQATNETSLLTGASTASKNA